jgi:hypothetical protein
MFIATIIPNLTESPGSCDHADDTTAKRNNATNTRFRHAVEIVFLNCVHNSKQQIAKTVIEIARFRTSASTEVVETFISTLLSRGTVV